MGILDETPGLISEKPPVCHNSDTMCHVKNRIPRCISIPTFQVNPKVSALNLQQVKLTHNVANYHE